MADSPWDFRGKMTWFVSGDTSNPVFVVATLVLRGVSVGKTVQQEPEAGIPTSRYRPAISLQQALFWEVGIAFDGRQVTAGMPIQKSRRAIAPNLEMFFTARSQALQQRIVSRPMTS